MNGKKPVAKVRCTQVTAQVNLGLYDAEGNLVGEVVFPQVDGNAVPARLFHPHEEMLANLIAVGIQQTWDQLNARGLTECPVPIRDISELIEAAPAANGA